MSDDSDDDSVWLDVLLFVLVLIGVIAAHRRKQSDEDDF